MQKLSKAYNPRETEDDIYKLWESSGFFNPDKLPKPKEPFSISMPPPNATGELHIGHALFITLQDLIIRLERMQGKKALWLPGTDHAAIATQNVVEKDLKKEGKTKYDLGREKFVERVEKYVEDSKGTIRKQIKKMGASCDWSRERYTLDKGLSKAVQTVFVQMYKEGLIYRGNRIVNWCPRCESTLADDEVEYQPEKTKLYYFNYGPAVVATTRPETKLGDTALAVNPNDKRYQKLVGKKFTVPWVKEGKFELKIIADKTVDPNFGTGVVKVTPAHDPADFEIGKRHHLPIISVIGKDGKMTKEAGKYAGMTVKECREKLVEEMKEQGILEKVEDYEHNLSVCYRCNTPIEPLISKQWFVAVDKPIKKQGGKTLKELSLEVVKNGKIKIIPERFKKVYVHWMENLHDWCISRQLWFGHRIPVWYREKSKIKNQKSKTKEDNLEIYVGLEPPKGEEWKQDPDVLDTWFSSGIWTFSTLGWPEKTKDLKTYHPTSVMETGYDILFFWVARMILMTTYLLGDIPFKTVYLHGLVRDKQGRKMSKSLGNGIDPFAMAEKFGADAVRLSLLIGNTAGNDFRLYEEKIAGYRNFVNKLWNISRFILTTVKKLGAQSPEPRAQSTKPRAKTLSDRWILEELENTTYLVTEKLAKFDFSQAGEELRQFTWDKLADWYLEIAKIDKGKEEKLLWILQQILVLWHPFIPFVTEKIWQIIFNGKVTPLMMQPWPSVKEKGTLKAAKEFSDLQKLVVGLRNFRAEYHLALDKRIPVYPIRKYPLVEKEKKILSILARAEFLKEKQRGINFNIGKFDFIIPLAELVDLKKEKERTEKELGEAIIIFNSLKNRLVNKDFVNKAPKEVIAKEREREWELNERIKKLKKKIINL